MSNAAAYANSTKKPCYRFIFPDADSAESFFKRASQDRDATRVQHPYSHVKRVTQDDKQVYVNGSGSTLFDVNLRARLIEAADELGGHILEA